MNDNRRWNRLMEINRKSCAAINDSKASGNNTVKINFSREELYEIASLSGDEATILRRKCLS